MSLSEEEKRLLNEGELLPIMEHFYTIQGEGFHSGTPAYFIRIGGCDVGCHWCDVKESWDADKHPLQNMKEIASKAVENCKTVVLTGGEPLMYQLKPLTDYLQSFGIKIHMETSGAYPLSGNFDWICLSPKKTKEPLPEILEKADELKMIIYNQNDFVFAEKFAEKVNENCELFLQPEWSKKDQMIPEMVNYVLKHPKWKISLQSHKYMNIP